MSLYPLQFWLADYYELYLQECNTVDNSAFSYPRLLKRFQTAIPDSDAAHYRCVRMLKAMEFLNQNKESIDFGNAAVVGKDDMLISKEVIITLHKFFAEIPDRELGNAVYIEDFLWELGKLLKQEKVDSFINRLF